MSCTPLLEIHRGVRPKLWNVLAYRIDGDGPSGVGGGEGYYCFKYLLLDDLEPVLALILLSWKENFQPLLEHVTWAPALVHLVGFPL